MRILVALVACFPVVALAQPAPKTVRWECVITVTNDATSDVDKHEHNHTEHTHSELHGQARVTAVFDAEPSAGSWQSVRLVSVNGSGTVHSSSSSHEVNLDVDADHHKETIDGTSEGTDVLDPTATKPDELSFVAGEAGIVVAATLHLKGSSTTKRTVTNWKGTKTTTDTTKDDAPSLVSFDGKGTKAMADAHRFTGTQTDTGDPKENAGLGMKQSTVVTVDIHPLAPIAKVELVVDAPNYDQWLPDPKSPIVVTATLKSKDGKVSDVKLSKLHFKLTGTSSEPGTSLNFPVAPKTTEKDLVLTSNGGREIGDDKQEIEFPFAHNSEQVALVANDYGCWGDLVVTGDLSDGNTVTGHLAGKPEGPILFPYRTGGSHVADAWKKTNHVTDKPDDEDEEAKPVGKSDATGDGFSVYEEYRGMQCGGAHIRLDPNVKDLFIRNEIGGDAKPGIGDFAKATQLAVHDCVAADEMPASRVMNANHREGPHVVDQHAIALRFGAEGKSEQIGTPGQVDHVSVDAKGPHVAALGELDWDVEVAHELLHSLGVEHHGEQDKTPVRWEWSTGGGLIERGDSSSTITVEDESGKVLGRDDINLKQLFTVAGPMSSPLYIAYPHGEHSGDENCLMRYAVSQPVATADGGMLYLTIFADETQPNVRHLVARREKIGVGLCTSAKGTGNNAAGHRPTRWHSDAQRGDCAHQFVVSDRHPIAQHAASKKH